jgi:hypothetical protein
MNNLEKCQIYEVHQQGNYPNDIFFDGKNPIYDIIINLSDNNNPIYVNNSTHSYLRDS